MAGSIALIRGGGICATMDKALMAERWNASAILIMGVENFNGFAGGWAFKDTWTYPNPLVQLPVLAITYSLGTILNAYGVMEPWEHVSHISLLFLSLTHTQPTWSAIAPRNSHGTIHPNHIQSVLHYQCWQRGQSGDRRSPSRYQESPDGCVHTLTCHQCRFCSSRARDK